MDILDAKDLDSSHFIFEGVSSYLSSHGITDRKSALDPTIINDLKKSGKKSEAYVVNGINSYFDTIAAGGQHINLKIKNKNDLITSLRLVQDDKDAIASVLNRIYNGKTAQVSKIYDSIQKILSTTKPGIDDSDTTDLYVFFHKNLKKEEQKKSSSKSK